MSHEIPMRLFVETMNESRQKYFPILQEDKLKRLFDMSLFYKANAQKFKSDYTKGVADGVMDCMAVMFSKPRIKPDGDPGLTGGYAEARKLMTTFARECGTGVKGVEKRSGKISPITLFIQT